MPSAAPARVLLVRPLLCAIEALRGPLGSATMTTPGGAGTTPHRCVATSSVLGAPASLIRPGPSHPLSSGLYRALSRPDAAGRFLCRSRAANTIHKKPIIPNDMGIPRPRPWPYRGGAMRYSPWLRLRGRSDQRGDRGFDTSAPLALTRALPLMKGRVELGSLLVGSRLLLRA
jgi:hypothetical protein